MENWHGQDGREVCEREGYAQMEWDGKFTKKTPFRFFRERPDVGLYVDEWTDSVTLFAILCEHRDRLERFASDLKDITKAPTNCSDALRLADSIEAYRGL